MHTVAILGAGDLGGALARTLAEGDAVSRVLLIDKARDVAAGKALDIRQSGPIGGFDTIVEGTGDVQAAAAADVLVVADEHAAGEWTGDAAVQLLQRVAGLAPRAPIVFAGAGQRLVMALALGELRISPVRLIGSAPAAAAAAVRALAAPALDASPSDVAVPVLGVPPRWVVAWTLATAAGAPADGIAPFESARVERLLAASWPPGPYSLASAAAMVIRAALTSSRRRACCFVPVPLQSRHSVIAAAPVILGPAGIVEVRMPELAPRERVALESALFT